MHAVSYVQSKSFTITLLRFVWFFATKQLFDKIIRGDCYLKTWGNHLELSISAIVVKLLGTKEVVAQYSHNGDASIWVWARKSPNTRKSFVSLEMHKTPLHPSVCLHTRIHINIERKTTKINEINLENNEKKSTNDTSVKIQVLRLRSTCACHVFPPFPPCMSLYNFFCHLDERESDEKRETLKSTEKELSLYRRVYVCGHVCILVRLLSCACEQITNAVCALPFLFGAGGDGGTLYVL